MDETADIVIVGAGPVGLTLAIDLAWRGIAVTVIEMRAAGEPPSPKCNHVAARTMETFRRLGIAKKVRNAGLPADYPNDVAYRTAFTGHEMARIPIPCRRDRYTDTSGPDGWWPTPEPPHRINQIYLEPLLFSHAQGLAKVRIVSRAVVERVEERGDGVAVVVRQLDAGTTRTLTCRYLVGCDGARSVVRKAIGARFFGDDELQRVQSTCIRAPGLIARQQHARAWATFSLNPVRSGNVYAIDGVTTWLVHNYLKPGERDFEAVDRDACLRAILGVGSDFNYAVLSKEDWIGRRLIADRFRSGRMFIAGDAAHIWVPFAGYGMNAGIADAMNLSWLLAAHCNGWAPAAILDAYERERLPITEQVSRFAMNHALAMTRQRLAVADNIAADDADGQAARVALGRQAYDLNVQQYCCAGLNFGSYYDGSPIVAYDGVTPPAYSMDRFTPSTVPGCRLPHLWLRDGRSLYDAMGPEYTLLRFDPGQDACALVAAAAARGMPLAVLDVAGRDGIAPYAHKLVLARPDQHVAWRGDAMPADPPALADRVRGAAPAAP